MLIMEQINGDEDTVKKLCVEVSAERNRARLRHLRSRLRAFLHEHASLLTSMSEDTYQALRQLRLSRVCHQSPAEIGIRR